MLDFYLPAIGTEISARAGSVRRTPDEGEKAREHLRACSKVTQVLQLCRRANDNEDARHESATRVNRRRQTGMRRPATERSEHH